MAFQHSPTPTVLLEPDGAVAAANPAFCRLVGRTQEEVLSCRISDLTHPSDRRETAAERRELLDGRTTRIELTKRYVRPDGSTVPVHVDAVAIPGSTGRVRYTLAQVRDLTAEQRAEQLAVRQQGLPALAHTVSLAANAGGTLLQVQQIALDQVKTLTGWRSGRALTAETGWNAVPEAPAAGRGPVVARLRRQVTTLAAPDATPLAVQLVDGPEAVCWTDASEVDPTSRTARGLELVVAVPVVVDDEVVAVLEFLHDDRTAGPDAALLATLTSVGVQLAHVVERERDRQALLAAAARERAVIEHAGDAYVETDAAGVITAWNPKAEQMFGWRALEVLGRPVGQVLVPPTLRVAHNRGIAQALARGHSRLEGQLLRLPALHRDGHTMPVEISMSLRPGADVPYVQAFLRDVTDRERAEQELRTQREFLDTVLDSLTDGVVACDAEGRLTLVNRSHLDLWQLPDEPRPPQEWVLDLQLFESDGVTPMPIERAPLFRALHGEHVHDAEVVLGRPGALRRFRCNARPLRKEDGSKIGAVCSLHDVTDQVAAQQTLTLMQRTDRVSGLPNATVLQEALAALPGRARYTLLQLHVEDLPVTVASEGVAAGDALVRALGARLRSAVRDVDLVTHSGAERFAVLLRHDARTDPRYLAERILDATSGHEESGGGTRRLRLSAGLAAVDRMAPVQSLSDSELALQTARTAGAGRLEVFAPAMAEQLNSRTALRRDLERAIADGELTLRYQPQFEVRTGRISGVEALVRWQHPRHGLVRPDEFIPLAEETGLILPLGRWVLAEACRQSVTWTAAGLAPVRMSVNVSGRQLDDSFPDTVAGVLAETGLPADLLELEMTETVAVANDPMAAAALSRLRRLGVRLSIDDFGTGYSMLGRLRALPFTQLKIDRSFVNEITGHGSAPLVRAMLTMAEGLGLDVVAEGVETAEQLAFLRHYGCPSAQGYLLARPVEPDAVAALLADPTPSRPFLDLLDEQPEHATTVDAVDLHALLAEIERLTGFESIYLTRVQDGEQQVVAARNTADLVVPEGGRWPWETSLCATALRDGAVAMSDVGVRHGDNAHVRDLRLASYLGVPVLGADGAPVGTLCAASTSHIDVAAETLAVVQVYASLASQQLLGAGNGDAEQRAVERAHAELARRASFLADAEHAVRQPLTALAGWADLLATEDGDLAQHVQREAAGKVASEARAVGRHLDRLLDEARTGVLRGSLQPQPLSLRHELTALLGDRPDDSAGSVRLEMGEDVTVVADPIGLRKIVQDLLDNAAGYSPAGSTARVTWRRAHAAVELTVVDEGVGLAADLDPFAPFSRGAQPEVLAVPGAGLSLYVSRSLAEAMGGALLGRRNQDRGSTFSLWLPAA